jgi:hypothetical protein
VLHGNSQRGQALPVVLVSMTLILLLAGGVTVGISSVIRRQAPDRTASANDLAAQNTVAAAAASLTSGGSACRGAVDAAATQPLLAPGAAASDAWDLSPDDGTWQTGRDGTDTTLTYDPAAARPSRTPAPSPTGTPTPTSSPPDGSPRTGVALARQGQGWRDYSATADLVPGSLGEGASVELDVRDQEGAQGWYFLALQGPRGTQHGARWVFGRAAGGQQAGAPFDAGSLPAPPPSQRVTLELDVVRQMITARISWSGFSVLRTHRDGTLGTGTVALRIVDDSRVEVDRVEVDPRFSLPAPTMVAIPGPIPGGSGRYGCQRVDQVQADQLAQRRVSLTISAPCQGVRVATGAGGPVAVPIPADDHRLVWFTMAVPQGQTWSRTLSLAPSCPAAGGSAECSLQQVTSQLAWGQQQPRPASIPVSVVADCSNTTGKDASYRVLIAPAGAGSLPAVNLRWAPAGHDSVYTTVAWLTGQQRYQESDFAMQGGSTALTYEGGLG